MFLLQRDGLSSMLQHKVLPLNYISQMGRPGTNIGICWDKEIYKESLIGCINQKWPCNCLENKAKECELT